MDWIVKNNIAVGQYGSCFVNDLVWGAGSILGGHNLSSDGTASAFGGTGNLAYKSKYVVLKSVTVNFSPRVGSPALNAGEDLSSEFAVDIAGTARSGSWDIGAFEGNVGGGLAWKPHVMISFV